MALNIPRLSDQTANALLQHCVVSGRNRWSVLKASGENIRDYLQGQITQDVTGLSASQAIHSAILTPQGKAISELYLLEGSDDELIVLTPARFAEATVGRLRQFALGYKLRIGIVSNLAICSAQGAQAHSALSDFGLAEPGERWLAVSRKKAEESYAIVMPETPRGFWIISSPENIDATLRHYEAVDESQMEAMRILRGFPDFGIEWDSSVHPLNANLVEFDGVSFDKGCYVGQEVTSRMHWRGGIKKKLYRVRIAGEPASLPCPIRSSANVGELKSAAIDHEGNYFGIASLPIETAESDAPLVLENDIKIEILEACHA